MNLFRKLFGGIILYFRPVKVKAFMCMDIKSNLMDSLIYTKGLCEKINHGSSCLERDQIIKNLNQAIKWETARLSNPGFYEKK